MSVVLWCGKWQKKGNKKAWNAVRMGIALISHCGDNWGVWGGEGGSLKGFFQPTLPSILDSLSSPPVWPCWLCEIGRRAFNYCILSVNFMHKNTHTHIDIYWHTLIKEKYAQRHTFQKAGIYIWKEHKLYFPPLKHTHTYAHTHTHVKEKSLDFVQTTGE